MHVGSRISEILKNRNISQADLARGLNKPPQYVTTLLKRKQPHTDTLKGVADFFEMSVDELENGGRTTQDKTVKPIPFYDIDVTAGQLTFFDNSVAEPQELYSMPAFQDCTAIFPIYGDSMYPRFRSGDRVIVKEYP